MSGSLQQAEKFWNKVCFDPAFKPRGRYRTYRELIVEGMEDAVRGVCPVARSILSEAEWHRLFLHFLKMAPPQSHILRDIAYEFADYLKSTSHPLKSKYPYLAELVEYEVAEIRLRFAPESSVKAPRGRVLLNPAHFLGTYRWPVHFIRQDFCDPKKIPRGDYRLLLWRDPKTLEVHFIEMNPLAATLLEVLVRGALTPRTALAKVARRHRIHATPEFLAEGSGLIRGFVEQGIILSPA